VRSQAHPLVSVIMPCYKMGRYIGGALESVGKQTYKNWEVIAVDDCGPEDGTQEKVENFEREFPNNRVVFHRHEINQGVSAARNSAISLGQGEYLAFLDPDDIWKPFHLERSINFLLGNQDFSVTCSPMTAFWEDGSNREIVWNFSNWQKDLFPYSLATNNFIQPTGVVVYKLCVEKVGVFTVGMSHGEDTDLWIRLACADYKFNFFNDSSCRYRKHPSAASANNFYNMQHLGKFVEANQSFILQSQGKLILQLAQKIEKMEQQHKSNLFRSIKRLLRLS
jgi:glycosyltransferase involved in cell wall biosynthesis